MSSSQTASSRHQTPEKTLLKRLRANQGALLRRNGGWHVLSPDGTGQRALPQKSAAAIAKLCAAGAVIEGEDGLFRPVQGALAAVRNAHESPLHRLLSADGRYGHFKDEHLRAAERLRIDFEKAHLSPRVTANYAPAEATTSRHWQMSDNAVARLTDGALAARQRLHDALEVVGPELSGLLLQVCCLTRGLEEAERCLALPRRSGRAVLLLGLTRLARHYGLKPRLRHAGPSQIGHWAVADYRPEIHPATSPATHARHQT
jgi:hypothetical protein